MKQYIPFFAVLFVFAGCDRSPYPDYKKIGEDTYLRHYMLGEGDRVPQDGDSVLMRLRISEVEAASGSLFSTEQWYAVEDLRESAYDEFMIRMHEGDSMSLIAPAARLPWKAMLSVDDTITTRHYDLLRTEASMLAIRTAVMMQAEEERLRAADPMGYEQQLLSAFLDDLGPNWQKWGTSMIHYTIQGIPMDTTPVKSGDLVSISYTGKRLDDGSTFDSTERNGGPLMFRFGDKHQVMNGLEVAVHLLREGQEGDFLFPSEYAFGPRGIEGMIAPYTPVIYTVRLEEVQRQSRRRGSYRPPS